MNRVLVEKTNHYLVLKIPLRTVETGRAEVSLRAQKVINAAIVEGLRDIDAGRVLGPFKNARELKTALGKLKR